MLSSLSRQNRRRNKAINRNPMNFLSMDKVFYLYGTLKHFSCRKRGRLINEEGEGAKKEVRTGLSLTILNFSTKIDIFCAPKNRISNILCDARGAFLAFKDFFPNLGRD